MTPQRHEDAELQDDLGFTVGEISGRLTAIEQRMDRFESVVGDQFSSMSNKLDDIGRALARQEARNQAHASVGRWSLGVMSAIGFVGAWLLNKFGGGFPH